MDPEELRKIAKEEISKSIMDNLDSALIFTYIANLEKENKELRDIKNKLMNIKLYACDTEKNKECNKKYCIENGGECDATTDKTMAKYVNLDDYVSKDKIKTLHNDWCSKIHILSPNSSGEEKRQEYIAEGAAEALEQLLHIKLRGNINENFI